MKKVITGNYAASYGARDSMVEVVSAYPITPQTQIVELLSEFCAEGSLKAEFIKVESEHSAMAACIGASITGARTFTATSSQGLLLMHEMLHWAVGARTPVVMANVNRAVGPPWSIWTDQQDSISQRDTGWLQFYCSSNQEVYDTVIQTFKICEKVLLPGMLILDAFILSHTYEVVDLLSQELVSEFLPPYNPKYKMDTEDPRAFGGLVTPDYYMELRYNINNSMEKAISLIKKVGKEFGERYGRFYDTLERYRTEDAEYFLVMSGSAASTALEAIDVLRKKGIKVGLVRVRVFRPFPKEDLRKVLEEAKKVIVMDRNISFGHEGAFSMETKAALHGLNVPIVGFVAGLGGREIMTKDLVEMVETGVKTEKDYLWWGVKE